MKNSRTANGVRTGKPFRWLLFGTTLSLMVSASVGARAQSGKPIVYPSGGQSLSQQSKDEGECQGWARQQTGFDPANTPQYASTSGGAGGAMVGGAARGAALGAVGGAIGGDAGKGAAIGAGVGATSGLMGRRRATRATAQHNDQAQANYNAGLQRFNTAFGTCMKGRGYTVN
jgi:hypothetical protein